MRLSTHEKAILAKDRELAKRAIAYVLLHGLERNQETLLIVKKMIRSENAHRRWSKIG